MSDGLTPRNHLFAVRIWAQVIEDGRQEWRGRVQHIETGQIHHFRDWSDLIAIVQNILPELDKDTTDETPNIYGGKHE